MGLLKPAVLFLLLLCLLQSRLVFCQQPILITLTEKDVTLQKALEDIHNLSGYTYYGKDDWTHLSHRVSFSVRQATVEQVLDSCFRDQPFTYRLVNGGIAILPREQNSTILHGRVVNEKNEPLEGATIIVKGDGAVATSSKDNGEFTVHIRHANTRLIISSVNYETQELQPGEAKELTVQLKEKIGEMSDVVVVHTGYQDVRKQGTTGSFDELDNSLLNRRISTNILDRIDGVASGVLFNKNIVNGTNQSDITIRGRSTIFANPNPLIVIDNFPYTGDINNLNPDDVESITILKDAAAASIWGAFSGNGVIVITTKKGKPNQAPKYSFTTSQTVGQRPNLYYLPVLSSSDYIDVEQFLFANGHYTSQLLGSSNLAVSPVVEILNQRQQGLISAADSATQINALRQQDVRRDEDKYLYRPSLNSQYALSVSGGSALDQYYLSAGYDRNLSNLVRNEYDRVTLNATNAYRLVPGKLELITSFAFTSSRTYDNNTFGTGTNYPYTKLADANGNPLPVNFQLRPGYIDTAGGGQLLDWNYRPLQELYNSANKTLLTDYRINLSLRYTVLKGLDAQAFYQYGRGISDNPNYRSLQTYYARNLINEFTQASPGGLSFPVPRDGILDETVNSYSANNLRGQLNYKDSSLGHGMLSVIAGAELRDLEGMQRVTRLYGYDPDLGSSLPVDYVDEFTQYSSGAQAQIQYIDQNTGTSARYLSYYTNAAYTYRGRYILSASARRDESNLFGVRANQKGVPLWSAGGGWELSREDFYKLYWLPFLKLRVSDGYNGNVDQGLSAFTTAMTNPQVNGYGTVSASILNPPNPNLRWERINIFNVGTDFSIRGDRLGGSLEYFIKSGKDLIGQSPVDPTTGVTVFTGNTANMLAHGVDLTLHANNNFGKLHWNSVLLFSLVRDKVTTYKVNQGTVAGYFQSGTLNPLVGKPLYSVYALRWEGLDPNGNPQGFLKNSNDQGGSVTTDYVSILNSPDLHNLVYKGPANPPVFGSWRNSLYWRQWGMSFNILYKLGYVFRRNSIDYSALFTGDSPGHPDYERRWQHPGDEGHTSVPRMIYPADVSRDDFYASSEILVDKGDHIRLQDVQFSYDLRRVAMPGLPVQLIRFYVYANNIGILWRANHQGIDPDFVTSIPNPRTLACGVKVDF